jgi:hypothetical protein
MGDDTNLVLIDSKTCEPAGTAEQRDQDVYFPEAIDDWKHVLDCRHAPYPDHSLEHNCELAAHVRKPYILVDASDFDELSDDELSTSAELSEKDETPRDEV